MTHVFEEGNTLGLQLYTFYMHDNEALPWEIVSFKYLYVIIPSNNLNTFLCTSENNRGDHKLP